MNIDVFHDTVCPWCRIGQVHLRQAIERWGGEPVNVHYRAFLLDPTTPSEGRPMSDLVAKLGGQARADEMHARVCSMGEACGVDFTFEQIQRIPNTIRSHQLLKLAPLARQEEVVNALHEAHFSRGQDIGDIDVLVDIAGCLGMDQEAVRDGLVNQTKLTEVLGDLNFAREAGITGVPFFIFDGKYALSGAQPLEVFVQVMEQISAEKVLE
ncbi:DsbA family oxidoreductase [Alicyclobacillus fastidiosus]|uniref:DsbA family oxidoreductase n=1 Tax=Alicyclobacillus fastidiosus TaxID=392011 RepID=A0ABV5AFC0_9BACL|nr:DsbA family oxidoreductase [Alicyclobacillus fastidiosus]WEH09862.1 DsbA family oxidoreductase [Alicyclobacillus fastidiosus]